MKTEEEFAEDYLGKWGRIPERMQGSLVRWIHFHVEPGHFLSQVLRNDLRRACERADDENQRLLFDYVFFLYNYAPGACWGSVANFDAWAAKRGTATEAHSDEP